MLCIGRDGINFCALLEVLSGVTVEYKEPCELRYVPVPVINCIEMHSGTVTHFCVAPLMCAFDVMHLAYYELRCVVVVPYSVLIL